jgi:hypothetical protein
MKVKLGEVLKKNLKIKAMHEQYVWNIDSFLWLMKGDLKAEIETEIVATQDQALQTMYFATKMLYMEADSKYTLC